MTVSAMIRWLIATFDWLESVAWPLLLCAWRNCKAVAQTVRQKFGSLRSSCVRSDRWSDLRLQLPGLRFQLEKSRIFPLLAWLGKTLSTCLIWSVSVSVFVAFWVWAWTP